MARRERGRGDGAASAGNHAQGVALAATLLGARAVVFMPVGTPIPKVEATRGYGAEVRFSGTTLDEALDAAREYAARSSAVLVHPFDHPDVIAGQGTTGLELTVQCPDLRTVLVPTGGGGLVSGVAVAVKALCHGRPGRWRPGGRGGGLACLAAGGQAPATRPDGHAGGRDSGRAAPAR